MRQVQQQRWHTAASCKVEKYVDYSVLEMYSNRVHKVCMHCVGLC